MVKRSISRAHLIALLAATASAGLPRNAGAQAAAAKIRMGAALGDTLSEPYYGLENGAFDQAGLSVSTTTFATGGAILQATVAGAVDVGLGDVIQITNAINAGIPFAIFAASALYSSDAPTTALVAAKDGPIRTAKDFEGKTIALNSLHSLPEISTREWLRQNGADPAATKFVEMTGTAMLESLVRGAIAGAVPGRTASVPIQRSPVLLGKPYDMVAKSFPLTLVLRATQLAGRKCGRRPAIDGGSLQDGTLGKRSSRSNRARDRTGGKNGAGGRAFDDSRALCNES